MKKLGLLGIVAVSALLFFSSNNSSDLSQLNAASLLSVNTANAEYASHLAPHAQSCSGGVKIVCYGNGSGCSPTICLSN